MVTSYTHRERPGRALSTSEAPGPSGERFVESPPDTVRGVVGGTSIFQVGRLRHEMTCLSLAASEWPGWWGVAGAGHGWGPCRPLQPLTAALSRQLYHACDGPGLPLVCFMRRDALEYFSVYGTALSMWVSLMGEWPRPVAQCPHPTIHLPRPETAEPADAAPTAPGASLPSPGVRSPVSWMRQDAPSLNVPIPIPASRSIPMGTRARSERLTRQGLAWNPWTGSQLPPPGRPLLHTRVCPQGVS